jgi:hypothetical protein
MNMILITISIRYDTIITLIIIVIVLLLCICEFIYTYSDNTVSIECRSAGVLVGDTLLQFNGVALTDQLGFLCIFLQLHFLLHVILFSSFEFVYPW